MQNGARTIRAARRLRTVPWRSPRLVLGVALVLAATALGGWLFSRLDGGERYWAVSQDVRAGEAVDDAQLTSTTARLDGGAAETAISASTPAVDGVWAYDLPAGAIVPTSAWTTDAPGGHELPLLVSEGAFPDDLARGDQVDVWAGPGPQQADVEAQRVLGQVVVRSVAMAPTGGAATIVVTLGDHAPSAEAVAALGSQHVTVVRRS